MANAMTVTADSGNLPRMGFSKRLLRKKTAAVDSGETTKPSTSDVAYAVTPISVGMDIDQRLRNKTISKEAYRAMVVQAFADQCGADLEDLLVNGNTATSVSDDDYDFLTINDGLVRIAESSGSVVDGSAINGGELSYDHFLEAAQQLDAKYIQLSTTGALNTEATSYRWLIGWHTHLQWKKYLQARSGVEGLETMERMIGRGNAPVGIPFEIVPSMPAGKILLASPEYCRMVRTEDMVILNSDQGRDAIRARIHAYALHGDVDLVVMENSAFVTVTGITT
jgi:hypothetical protein